MVRRDARVKKGSLYSIHHWPGSDGYGKKVITSRIPVLVSKSVPTDAAVEMARAYNLTLICKAWPGRYEIFHEAANVE